MKRPPTRRETTLAAGFREYVHSRGGAVRTGYARTPEDMAVRLARRYYRESYRGGRSFRVRFFETRDSCDTHGCDREPDVFVGGKRIDGEYERERRYHVTVDPSDRGRADLRIARLAFDNRGRLYKEDLGDVVRVNEIRSAKAGVAKAGVAKHKKKR